MARARYSQSESIVWSFDVKNRKRKRKSSSPFILSYSLAFPPWNVPRSLSQPWSNKRAESKAVERSSQQRKVREKQSENGPTISPSRPFFFSSFCGNNLLISPSRFRDPTEERKIRPYRTSERSKKGLRRPRWQFRSTRRLQ